MLRLIALCEQSVCMMICKWRVRGDKTEEVRVEKREEYSCTQKVRVHVPRCPICEQSVSADESWLPPASADAAQKTVKAFPLLSASTHFSLLTFQFHLHTV
jgi:hypothetical protein